MTAISQDIAATRAAASARATPLCCWARPRTGSFVRQLEQRIKHLAADY